MEGRAEIPRVHPALEENLSFRMGEESAGPNRVYTDGSKCAEGTGAAWVAFRGGVEVERGKIRLHTKTTVLQAELVALREALRYIVRNAYQFREWAILTDSMSGLKKLKYCNRPTRSV